MLRMKEITLKKFLNKNAFRDTTVAIRDKSRKRMRLFLILALKLKAKNFSEGKEEVIT